jgi:lysophospholipase L1-like esterase
MKRPTGGRFEIQLDGAVVREIDTRSPRVEAGFERVDAPDGKHELRVRILGHGMVRLYGVAIERGDPSVVVDALGTGALNMQQMATVQPDTRRAQLARRAHDLVILHLGTNMLGTKAELVEETRAVIGELRAALPGAAILILSPPDTFEEGTERDGHANAMAPLLARIAAENGVAYWDFHAAMGGAGSIRTFVKKGLAWGDHIHLTKPGHERMADRMLCAVSDGMAAYLERNPRAGCGDR